MSDFNNNLDNQEFIKKLELLRDLEAEKPVEEMDVSLVMACVELILELRGETVNFTPEEVEEKVRKIPFVEETSSLNTPPQSVKSRSTKVKSRKILLIAAIISILIAIFAVSSIAFDWNIFDELKNRFGTVFDVPVNQVIDVDGVSVVRYGEDKDYENIEIALQSEDVNILYPLKISNDVELKKLLFYQKNQQEKINFVFDDEELLYSVTLNETLSDDIKNIASENLKISGYDCYLIEMNDIGSIQIYFDYNGNSYKVTYNNKQDLLEIIENLKVSR